MIKHIIIPFLFIGISINTLAQDEPQTPSSSNMDSLQTTVSKLMEFYDSYDDGSPESQKKAKYEDAVDEMSGGTVSEKDKADAYQIIDAYIKADKALEQDSGQQNHEEQSLDEAIQNTEEARQAEEFVNNELNRIQQMSYPEYEAYLLSINPGLSKKDMKEAYNVLHQNDDKQVPITADDEEMTPEQEQMWAIETLQNPKSCADYRKALSIINKQLPESEIQKVCNKIIN